MTIPAPLAGRVNQMKLWALTNDLEFRLLTRFAPMWGFIQAVKPLERRVNRRLIDLAVNKAKPRPYRLSTMAPYTSWASLTDKSYNARQLAPADARAQPAAETVAGLFARGETMVACPKSTVLLPYFAQWFTDGFLRSRRPTPPARFRDIRRNESNHEVDLMQLYGLSADVTDMLRAKDGGRLKSIEIGGEEYPPLLCAEDATVKPEFAGLRVFAFANLSDDQKRGLFAMGSDVANSQVGYAMINILFLREHNRLAREVSRRYGWDDDRVFETARNILTVLLIKLVIEEYINHLAPYHFKFRLDPGGFEKVRWQRPNWEAVEFNLLYRWHSLVPSTLRVDGADLPLADTLFNNDLLTRRGLGQAFADASAQRAGKVGLFNTDQWFASRTTLPSILQSREVDLASYNDYRVDCKFPPAADFDQVSSDPRIRKALRDAYGSVDEIEFYPGLFAEDNRPNSVLPSLMGRMVAVHAFSQLMTNPLLAPAVYTEQTFSPYGMQTIATTSSISQLLQRNLPAGSPRFFVSLTRKGWVPL